MRRLLVVYNPRSSRAADVRKEVLDPARELSGYMVGKYEVEKIGLEQNVAKLAKILGDGDIVLAAGGDATAAIAVNAILESGRDVTLAVLPYGNFNDLARTLGVKSFDDVFGAGPVETNEYYVLDVTIDNKHWRYATCYVTIGMTAEAVKLYDGTKMRKKLQTWWGRYVGSYVYLAGWYFKHRRKNDFLPRFKLNGVLQSLKTSDYMAINGKSMARVMRGGGDWTNAKQFRSKTDKLVSFWRLMRLMGRSILINVPGDETKGDKLEFVEAGKVTLQAEGEALFLENVKKIEIKKASRALKVLARV